MLLGFGPRPKPTPQSPGTHYGQDYGNRNGQRIYAAAAGRVKAFAPAGAYGNRLIIDHGNRTETWYCHLDYATVPVSTQVTTGQLIADMGATGNALGVHLHFELRVSGVAVDPEPHFRSTEPASPGGTPLPPEEDDMPLYELIRTPDGTVWWCVDRVTRYGIPNETVLASYQFLLGSKGLPTTILNQGNGDAFGTPVFRNGAPATNLTAGAPVAVFTDEMLEKVAAAVEARLQDEFAAVPAHVIEEQKKPGN